MRKKQRSHLKPLAVALAIACAGTAGITCPQPGYAQQAQAFNIPSGPLAPALRTFAKETGLLLTFNESQTNNKSTAGVKGSFSTQEALKTVLHNTGLHAVQVKDGTFVLQITPDNTRNVTLDPVKIAGNQAGDTDSIALAPVKVKAKAENTGLSAKNGSAKDGYVVGKAKSLSVWGDMSLQDAPYSISVISSDLMENMAISDMGKFAKSNPVMMNGGLGNLYGELDSTIRGFGVTSALIDGIPLIGSYFGSGTEEMERVEVISGLSGFLYGAGNVGGTINYVLKRPTSEPMIKVTAGNYGGANYYSHIDAGGPIDKAGKFGYRLNLLYQNGDTAIENQSIEEKLFSGAIDYHVTSNLLLQLYASHRESKMNGTTPLFFITGPRPSAYDASKSYTPDWSFTDVDADKFELRAQWDITDNIKFRTAYLYKDAHRQYQYWYNNVNTTTNTFTRDFYSFPPEQTYTSDGGYAYLDGNFTLGPTKHSMTIGASFGRLKQKGNTGEVYYTDPTTYTNVNAFNNMGRVSLGSTGLEYVNNKNINANLVLGDNIKITDQWSALVGVNLASMETRNFKEDGTQRGSYHEVALTPSFSLIYKPLNDLTTYATYMEALQSGTIVGKVYNNEGEVFKPLISRQYEVGAKYALHENLLLSTALFRIEKANDYSIPTTPLPTLTQDGLQVHQGIELLATGKVTDDLTISGGITWMDLSIEKASNASLKGKSPTGVASFMAKMYAEYRLPFLPQLVVTGGVYYTGEQWDDSDNTQKLPDYTLLDLGARYETKLAGYDTTLRLNVSNVTGVDYWASSKALGEPRSIAFSATVKF